MITKELKILKLLKEYPGSIDVLIRINPHFEKLKNKVLRKALAGRVTLEQAASIGGVSLDKLLTELNSAAGNIGSPGISTSEEDVILETGRSGGQSEPGYLTAMGKDKKIHFDVRPIIDSGQDPLKEILSKIKKIRPDEVLVIKNSFEPIPLYTLLGKKGFSHWTEKKADCFNVYFYKESNIKTEAAISFDSSIKFDESEFEQILEIDVHDLQPPEPMLKILENLHRVNEKTLMLVYHHRQPILLYPKLDERGFRAYCEKIGDENYKILIGKKR